MSLPNTSPRFQNQEKYHLWESEMLRGIARRHPEAKPDEYAVLWQRKTKSPDSKHKWHGFIPKDWIDGVAAGQDILPGVLEVGRRDNVFLTVSRYFKGWAITPLLKTFGALYVDIDCGKEPFNLEARDVWEAIQSTDILGEAGLPLPSLVVFTGEGLHLHWILGAEGAEAYFHRQKAYRQCQEKLIALFKGYGVDEVPKDPTRFLRLEGSTHHIGGPEVVCIEVGEATHSFTEMAKALGVQTDQRKAKGKKHKGRIRGGKYVAHLSIQGKPGPFSNPEARRFFGHLRMADLVAVNEDIGGFVEGQRNVAILAYVTAGRLAGKSDQDMEAEAVEFNRGFSPPLKDREVENVVFSITRRRDQLNSRGKYAVHANRTLIDLLGVTEEQQRRLYLRTLISPQEKERRRQENLQQSPTGQLILKGWHDNPGITQKALGSLIGVHQSAVSRTLQGAGITPNNRQGRPRKNGNHNRQEIQSQQCFAVGW